MNRKSTAFRSEPAVIITAFTAVVTEVFGLAIAFGIHVSDAQQTAIISTVTALSALIALLGPIIRGFVYSPRTHAQDVAMAKEAASKGETVQVRT